MAQFLRRNGCSHHIDEIVHRAKEKVWLISPFIKIADHLKELLQSKDRDRIDMRLVYGKSELREGEREWLKSLESLRIFYRENLHAKCYMNEDVALITSMNLYEFSQIHNDEWGILVSRHEDEELYQDILDEANLIFQNSKPESSPKESAVDSQSASAPAAQTETAEREPSLPKTGFCIRDGEPIEFDVVKPYCDECFRVWNRHKNREYVEEMCHSCGIEEPATMDRPLCLDCCNVELLAASDLQFAIEQTPSAPAAQTETAEREPSLPETGVCIRDGEPIGFDILKPYCVNCFMVWNMYKNREYEENLCHSCGRDWETGINRPLCHDCYRKYAGLLVARGHGRRQPEIVFCIRDGEFIEFDVFKPYCDKCFRSWNRCKNRGYEENMCHVCGREGTFTMDFPVCLYCLLNVEYMASFQVLWDNSLLLRAYYALT